MPIDPLQLLMSFSRVYAEQLRALERTTEQMFLLGIEIGRGTPLTAKEKASYGRTQATARRVLAMRTAMEGHPQQQEVASVITDALVDWLREEPTLKKTLEEWFQDTISDMPMQPPAEHYLKLKTQLQTLASATGHPLSDVEVEELAQKLLFPFDRP